MATAELLNDQLIRLDTSFSEKNLVQLLPGKRWHNDDAGKYWTVPLSWASCITLRGVFGTSVDLGTKLIEWAWSAREHAQTALDMRMRIDPEPRKDEDLYPFQEAGVQFLLHTKSALLGDDMGTGKTIQALRALRLAGDALPALIVCPNAVKRNWEAEAERWFPEAVTYVIDSGKGRDRILNEAAKDPNALVIINFEALRMLSRLAAYGSIRLQQCSRCQPTSTRKPAACQAHDKALNLIKWRSVVVDEAHRIKDPKSQQTRATWALGDQTTVQYRWAMTGTPIANHPGDLWSILRFLDKKSFPGRTAYVDRYCEQAYNPVGALTITGIRKEMRQEFYQLLDPHFRALPKELVLTQLPEKIRITRWVDMTPGQRKAYNDLEQRLGTVLPDGTPLVVKDPLVAKIRQMQFASSSLTFTTPEDETDLAHWNVKLCEPSPKLDMMEEILDELGEKPVVICAESRQLIELAAKRLEKMKISHGLITGAVPTVTRDRVLREFQRGELRVLLFTIKAGGTGLTMTAADTIIFLQRAWSMIDNMQAEDRVHRIGSEVHDVVRVIDIVTRESVEIPQIHSLNAKVGRLEEIKRAKTMLHFHGSEAVQNKLRELNEEEAKILGSEL